MFIVDALFNKLSSGLSGYRVDILEKNEVRLKQYNHSQHSSYCIWSAGYLNGLERPIIDTFV